MTTSHLAEPTTFAGKWSEGEKAFLEYVRDLARAGIQGRLPFIAVTANLVPAMRTLRDQGFEVPPDWRPVTPVDVLVGSPSGSHLKPSGLERSFLEDVEGWVDFASRNGVSFPLVATGLMHDFLMIVAHGGSLEKAVKEECFRPQVTGWAKRNLETVGEADE